MEYAFVLLALCEGNRWPPMESDTKGQTCLNLIFTLMTNGWTYSDVGRDFKRHDDYMTLF